MSSTDANAALDRMEADDAFAVRVRDAGGPEASFAVLRAEGFDVAPHELRDAVLDRYGEIVTAEQLDAIAGGIEISDDVNTVIDGALVGATLACAAVAAAFV